MKRFLVGVLFIFSMGFSLSAQDEGEKLKFDVTGNLTTIYTFGNANKEQMLSTGTGDGAYEEQKNGYFIEANLYVLFRPVSFMEGYFKLYAIGRPGSFYVPLSIETKSVQNFGLTLDKVWGRVNVFDALDLSLPAGLYLKTGKYKAEPAYYQGISKFGLERITYMVASANTYNYEIEAALNPFDDFTVSAAFVGNYRFNEDIPRLYDDDGGVSPHGMPVLGEYAPQYMGFLRLTDLMLGGGRLMAEFIYGQNVSNIYSGHSFGAGILYTLPVIEDTLAIPVGMGFAWHEKNIDLLSKTASTDRGKETVDLRNSLSGALSTGARFKTGSIGINGYLTGVLTRIDHIYRDPLQIISGSAELQFTFVERFFIGGGIVAGTLTDANWKTKEDPKYIPLDGIEHTFTLAENIGYEVYGGLNLWENCRFVVGFNRNKGIAMNYNLENKSEGQIKYQLADWDGSGQHPLYEAGGIYLKFVMSW